MGRRIAVLVMAYGTASGPDDVERYYTDIRSGSPPPPHLLKELKDRYAAIGNRFPLLDITRRQGAALEVELNRKSKGGFRVYLGMKHSPPSIGEGVAAIRADGVERAVGLVMAPHYSRLSVETYIDRVQAALQSESSPKVGFTFVRSWHDHPLFVSAVASRVDEALGRLGEEDRRRATVIFSAHSLPARIADEGDPYPGELRRTAELVASRLDLPSFVVAWQSAGRTPEPWLAPDLGDVIRDLAANGVPALVVCPCGFVADHLEILYDVDIEAHRSSEKAGVKMVRTRSMNDDPDFIAALARVVEDHLASRESASTPLSARGAEK